MLTWRGGPGPPLLQFPALAGEPGLVCVYTTRAGGRSRPPWDSLNLGLHVGDRPEDVLANRARVLAGLGLSLDALVCGQQVHGVGVARVGAAQRGRGARSHELALAGVDGLVTAEPGVALACLCADCLPLVLYAPAGPALGVFHAGWRGLARGMGRRAVEVLTGGFGVSAAGLWAALGPCIGPCCYEVGAEVAGSFPGEVVHRQGERRHLDLAAAAAAQLLEAGVPAGRILRTELCTRCRQDLFFSHRGSGGPCGRQGAVAALVA